MIFIDNKAVGERIAYLRVNNHYTREEFAEIIGISSKFLYEIEIVKKKFSVDILYNIATSFGVSCDYLIIGVHMLEE